MRQLSFETIDFQHDSFPSDIISLLDDYENPNFSTQLQDLIYNRLLSN